MLNFNIKKQFRKCLLFSVLAYPSNLVYRMDMSISPEAIVQHILQRDCNLSKSNLYGTYLRRGIALLPLLPHIRKCKYSNYHWTPFGHLPFPYNISQQEVSTHDNDDYFSIVWLLTPNTSSCTSCHRSSNTPF